MDPRDDRALPRSDDPYLEVGEKPCETARTPYLEADTGISRTAQAPLSPTMDPIRIVSALSHENQPLLAALWPEVPNLPASLPTSESLKERLARANAAINQATRRNGEWRARAELAATVLARHINRLSGADETKLHAAACAELLADAQSRLEARLLSAAGPELVLYPRDLRRLVREAEASGLDNESVKGACGRLRITIVEHDLPTGTELSALPGGPRDIHAVAEALLRHTDPSGHAVRDGALLRWLRANDARTELIASAEQAVELARAGQVDLAVLQQVWAFGRNAIQIDGECLESAEELLDRLRAARFQESQLECAAALLSAWLHRLGRDAAAQAAAALHSADPLSHVRFRWSLGEPMRLAGRAISDVPGFAREVLSRETAASAALELYRSGALEAWLGSLPLTKRDTRWLDEIAAAHASRQNDELPFWRGVYRHAPRAAMRIFLGEDRYVRFGSASDLLVTAHVAAVWEPLKAKLRSGEIIAWIEANAPDTAVVCARPSANEDRDLNRVLWQLGHTGLVISWGRTGFAISTLADIVSAWEASWQKLEGQISRDYVFEYLERFHGDARFAAILLRELIPALRDVTSRVMAGHRSLALALACGLERLPLDPRRHGSPGLFRGYESLQPGRMEREAWARLGAHLTGETALLWAARHNRSLNTILSRRLGLVEPPASDDEVLAALFEAGAPIASEALKRELRDLEVAQQREVERRNAEQEDQTLAAAARLAVARASEREAERLAVEREAERLAAETKLAASRAHERSLLERDAARAALARAAAEREAARLAEAREAERLAAQREAERLAREHDLERRLAEQERDRLANERAAAEREAERLASERVLAEREAERLAALRKAAEQEAERLTQERLAAEREAMHLAKQRAAAERVASERAAEIEQLTRSRHEIDERAELAASKRFAAEAEAERVATERLRLESEAQRMATERLDRERDAQRLASERLADDAVVQGAYTTNLPGGATDAEPTPTPTSEGADTRPVGVADAVSSEDAVGAGLAVFDARSSAVDDIDAPLSQLSEERPYALPERHEIDGSAIIQSAPVQEPGRIARLRAAIERWFDRHAGSAFETSASKLAVIEMDDLPIFSVVLNSRIERREVRQAHGGERPTDKVVVAYDSHGVPDAWSAQLPEVDTWDTWAATYGVDEPRQPHDCAACSGKGRIGCTRCNGSGTRRCVACQATGSIGCPRCAGAGEMLESIGRKRCTLCDGRGVARCAECKLGRIDCTACAGERHVRCERCDGRGETDSVRIIEQRYQPNAALGLASGSIPEEVLSQAQQQALAPVPVVHIEAPEIDAFQLANELSHPGLSATVASLLAHDIGSLSLDARVTRQRLLVRRYPVCRVRYRCDGETYELWIHGLRDEVFAADSPLERRIAETAADASRSLVAEEFERCIALLSKLHECAPEHKEGARVATALTNGIATLAQRGELLRARALAIAAAKLPWRDCLEGLRAAERVLGQRLGKSAPWVVAERAYASIAARQYDRAASAVLELASLDPSHDDGPLLVRKLLDAARDRVASGHVEDALSLAIRVAPTGWSADERFAVERDAQIARVRAARRPYGMAAIVSALACVGCLLLGGSAARAGIALAANAAIAPIVAIAVLGRLSTPGTASETVRRRATLLGATLPVALALAAQALVR